MTTILILLSGRLSAEPPLERIKAQEGSEQWQALLNFFLLKSS